MDCRKQMRRFAADTSGATIVEFAIVSTVFFMMMFALIEYGMIMMTKIAIESVTQEVSRSNQVNPTVAGCAAGDRTCLIQTLITQKTFGLVNPSYVQVTSTVITNPTTASPPIPDLCLDTPNVPNPPTCTKYIDNNGIPGYQYNGAANDFGSSGTLVELRVTYSWQILFPLMAPFFKDGKYTISSSTVVENEPSSS